MQVKTKPNRRKESPMRLIDTPDGLAFWIDLAAVQTFASASPVAFVFLLTVACAAVAAFAARHI